MAISVFLPFLEVASRTRLSRDPGGTVWSKQAAGKRSIAEIGVWHGVTTCHLRAGMAPDGVLYAIDPYPGGRLGLSLQRQIARTEVGRLQQGRVEWVRKTGAEAAQDLARDVAGRVEPIDSGSVRFTLT